MSPLYSVFVNKADVTVETLHDINAYCIIMAFQKRKLDKRSIGILLLVSKWS